ncbi:MAG: rRNA methyltransferase [Candidatus Cloacimonetes bacterium 4572_55]|nr:MAG: rRNA methyltransferase [Candidatus Cloacimonetes bacterium 4572_55]
MNQNHPHTLINYLSKFITEHKKRRFEEVLRYRTRYMTVVLEDIYQPHNASAVVRSCDCFGVQDLHIIENRNQYRINPDVTLGSSKWVNLFRYNHPGQKNTEVCLSQLRSHGYRLIATTPHRDDYSPDALPIDGKFALLFGTEETGLTKSALDMADEYVRIPMVGFTESFNISVSAAIILYQLTTKLWCSEYDWRLTEPEREEIRLQWVRQILKKRIETLEQEFFKIYKSEN